MKLLKLFEAPQYFNEIKPIRIGQDQTCIELIRNDNGKKIKVDHIMLDNDEVDNVVSDLKSNNHNDDYKFVKSV